MKQKLIGLLALPVLFSMHTAPVYAFSEVTECRRGTCNAYDKNTYVVLVDKPVPTWTDPESCAASDNCWVLSFNACFNINAALGYDEYKDDCGKNCMSMGYDVAVLGNNNDRVGCACYNPDPEWRTYKTGVLRRYAKEHNSSLRACVDVALDEYKCASDYYGTAPNGCLACPANATCSGDVDFHCDQGYYPNAAKTGCNRCPDSKEGGLGWDDGGNGVSAINGQDSIDLCEISIGTVLHDVNGTFEVTDDGVGNGCLYYP